MNPSNGLFGLPLACSGPHAKEVMLTIELIGLVSAVVTVIFTLASIRLWKAGKRKIGYPIAFVVLSALHPTWWISAFMGDCGLMLLISSTFALYAAIRLRMLQTRSLKGQSFKPPPS
jgi:uncharacterized membrane protein